MDYTNHFIAKDRIRERLEEAEHERLLRAAKARPQEGGTFRVFRLRLTIIRRLARLGLAS